MNHANDVILRRKYIVKEVYSIVSKGQASLRENSLKQKKFTVLLVRRHLWKDKRKNIRKVIKVLY